MSDTEQVAEPVVATPEVAEDDFYGQIRALMDSESTRKDEQRFFEKGTNKAGTRLRAVLLEVSKRIVKARKQIQTGIESNQADRKAKRSAEGGEAEAAAPPAKKAKKESKSKDEKKEKKEKSKKDKKKKKKPSKASS
jgi:hypothetical protein